MSVRLIKYTTEFNIDLCMIGKVLMRLDEGAESYVLKPKLPTENIRHSS